MRRKVVAIGIAGVLLAGLTWFILVSASDRGDAEASAMATTTAASTRLVMTSTAETSVAPLVPNGDSAVLVEIEELLTSVSENPSALAWLVAPEMRLAVDLGSALPEGAKIVPVTDSLLVSGSSAAVLAVVSLPTGDTDLFLAVFAEIEGDWLLASTLRVGER